MAGSGYGFNRPMLTEPSKSLHQIADAPGEFNRAKQNENYQTIYPNCYRNHSLLDTYGKLVVRVAALFKPSHELPIYGGSVPVTDHPDFYNDKTSEPKNK